MLKYSPDGNIISQLRTATASMDSLSYFYIPNADPLYPSQQSNRLNYVKDQAGNAGLGDLPNQTTGNYTYTANGNLSADASENLAYTWTPSNKLERVIRTIGANSHTFRYTYDAFGNRLSKRTTFSTGTVPNNDTTWYYVRDAQGNPLATYVRYGTGLTSGPAYYDMYLKEHIVYGSERLGSQGRNRLVYRTFGALPSMTDTTRQFLGMMAYEITNHLGNVLATVSDRHISRAAAPGAVNYYLADILTQTDYYPFGMGMPGRTFSGEKYRYGFNGKENDNEIHGTGNQQDYGDRLFDSRLGRWLSIDPLQSKYADLTPYSFAGDNPIRFVDFNGQDFGVKINHTDKTIVIVSNIYTTSKKAYNEVQKAAKQWNDKSATIEGYLVSFQIKIMEPVSSITNDEAILEDPSIIRRNGRINIRKLNEAKKVLISQKVTRGAKYDKENAGNAYASNEGRNSKYVTGEVFTGGQTENGRYADMNTHESLGNMGAIADLVAHEIGHFMGLNDHDKGPYYANGGIMEYSGTDLAPVSVDDVKNILSFAKNAFLKKTDPRAAKVSLIENVGKSNGINPLGIKNE